MYPTDVRLTLSLSRLRSLFVFFFLERSICRSEELEIELFIYKYKNYIYTFDSSNYTILFVREFIYKQNVTIDLSRQQYKGIGKKLNALS